MEAEFMCDKSFDVREYIKEMKNLTIEELKGVIHCIENDSSVTYSEKVSGGFKKVIHGDEAICVYAMASCLLSKNSWNGDFQEEIKWKYMY